MLLAKSPTAATRRPHSRASLASHCKTLCLMHASSMSRPPGPRSSAISPMPPRLGLWGTGDFPFVTRAEFVAAMEAGGIAAMEMISRDLKALGLYLARSLSYAGVEYEMLVHDLTPPQIAIYDSYADAYQIIHTNLEAALQASGISSETGTLNAQAKSAARSASRATNSASSTISSPP